MALMVLEGSEVKTVVTVKLVLKNKLTQINTMSSWE